MDKKDIDWGNLGFGYIEPDKKGSCLTLKTESGTEAG